MVVISLGWGVQSFTLAAMSALGELPPVDAAIHADTTWERSATYAFAARWMPWLEEHDMRVVTVNGVGCHNDPITIGQSEVICIPAYTITLHATSRSNGTLRRQCTNDWKIAPIRRWLQANRGGKPVEQWIGISKDEWTRAKDADVKYITHCHPLLEMGMTRADCIAWLEQHNLEIPSKSSCTFCPFHDKQAWQDMKRENGADWAQAVAIDAAIRDKRPPYPLYVHRNCKPLPEAVGIPEDTGYEQVSMLDICDSGACFL